MLGIKDIIYRYRHNRGFGVQSPYAFHFVTSVLREKHHYYAYAAIGHTAKQCGARASHCRRLFRITNYARPGSILLTAPDAAAAHAITAARPSAQVLVVDGTHSGKEFFTTGNTGWMLYVGHTADYATAVGEALTHTGSNSIVIVEGIHTSRKKREWWESIKQNSAVGVTFDLYSMGIMFFDKKYKKQHYTLKM